jgi:uncharacterized protein YbaR (Trm112 family)
MPRSILPLLVCPNTKQHLFLLQGEKAEVIESALRRGELRYIDGTKLSIEPGRVKFLITENAHHLYSMIDGVPVLLESKQIDMRL